MRGTNLLKSEIGSSGKYCLYNGHGDVVQLSSSTGAILWRYEYDAFGNERAIDGQNPANGTNPFRYCGEYFDKETVAWNNRMLFVYSKAENNGVGNIYVDDSLFVNEFGMGTETFIVWQDEVTRNVSIRANSVGLQAVLVRKQCFKEILAA